MGLRVCAEPGCPKLQAEPRCPDHRRQRDRARGTRHERGYDAAHVAERERLTSYLQAGVPLTCWRCNKPIGLGDEYDLGHCDDSKVAYHGLEHVSCNRGTASRRGKRCPHSSHM